MDSSISLKSLMVVTLPIAIIYLIYKLLFEPSILPDLPIIGFDKKQWFGWPRTLYRSFHNFRHIYDEAYEKYLSKGKPCIMPLLNDTHVVLPTSMGQWLIDQPDSVLSSLLRQRALFQTEYTFPVPKMASKTYHVQVIKTDLTRKLNTLTQDVWEGLADGFEASWGNDTKNWKTVNVFQTMTQIVTRTSNRVFVGKEYSGNETYLKLCTSFAHDIPLSSIAIKQWPRFLRPLVGPILSLPNRYHNYKIQEILRPEILRRLQYSDDATDAPNDFLQWYISYARDSLETEELLPEILSARIATMNFAAVHTSTFTSVNAIYDIVSSPMKDSITSWITTEFEDILATADGNLAKVNVQKMACTDSILRESLRFSSGSTGALHRVVATKNGVTTPDGLHIKQGNVISIPAWPVHRDPEIYQDPDSFMPLRFLRSSVNDKEKNHEPKTRSTNTVDTSLTFLSFGHGKHGCPGRFFAAQEMKLLLAYMMTYYDIEPLETRPEPISFGSFMTPNPRVSIRVRRKE